jgi:solute carrier family 10 (sodium/bile acid cotransporter), member 7
MNGRAFWFKYWFFAGIAAAVAVAFLLPGVGLFIRTFNLLDGVIFVAFLLTGLTLETSSIKSQLKNIKVLTASLTSSLVLFPAMAYMLALVFFGASTDAAVGVLILGVSPVTVASGTVMTAMAMGNVALSLFICVLYNFVSIFTIPFILNLVLSFGTGAIDLPILETLRDLTIKVLVPTVIGQLLRPRLKTVIAPYAKVFSLFNQSLVLMIILNAVSSSTDRIVKTGPAMLGILIFMLGLHLLILQMNDWISRFIRLDLASTAAFTLHTSQKTLTISYLVWAGYFAQSFPMALIPSILYHIVQMIADTFVAQRFRKKALELKGLKDSD